MFNKYPRPQLVRDNYQLLNGKWKVNGVSKDVPSCEILQELTYIKQFNFKRIKDRVILHFDGVDQICKVYLNDNYLGEHIGGYLPFRFEISDIVKEGKNILRVEVVDKLDKTYPYGKQSLNPSGMWYTPVSGIWKDVWLEQVPKKYIKDIKITPDLKGVDLLIKIDDGKKIVEKKKRINERNPILWDVDNPHLYYREIKQGDDVVTIYYGLRKIEIIGNRVYLNNNPIFINGVLDQGYWKDSLFIPKSYQGYIDDIKNMKQLGINLLRKHIKVEPDCFYYECDRLGMLVMQDMVQSGEFHFIKEGLLATIGFNFNDRVENVDERMKFFIEHSKNIQDHLYNHPSLIAYTIFNEGWGQFNSDDVYKLLKARDDSRLYDSTSGWFKQKYNDFDSLHIYFRNKKLKPKNRPMIVSECGGYVYNTDNSDVSWGYGKCNSKDELTSSIEKLYDVMILPYVGKGLVGIIYTQLSDVEGEVNGLYSFDRKILKVDKQRMLDIKRKIEERL